MFLWEKGSHRDQRNHYSITYQCSVTFWYGFGSEDPYHWTADPDPALFFSRFHKASKLTRNTGKFLLMTYCRYIYISLHWKVIKKSQNCENQEVFTFFLLFHRRILIREAQKLTDPNSEHRHKFYLHSRWIYFFNRDWISLFDVLPGSWLGSNIQVSEAYLERLSDAAMETYAMVATLSRYSHWRRFA